MARKKHDELIAGTLILSALAVAFGIVLWLGMGGLFAGKGQRVYFYADISAGSLGLIEGNFVQLNDATVGRIGRIRFEPDQGRTYYVAEIDTEDVKVYENGRARVTTGLVGEGRLVIVDRGSEDHPQADGKHPVPISGGLDQAMLDLADGAGAIKRLIDVLAGELEADRPDSLLSRVKAAAGDLAGAADDISAMTSMLRPQMDPSQPDSALSHIHSTARDASATAANLRRQMNLDDPDSILARLGRTSALIEQAAGDIRSYTRNDIAEILADLRKLNTELLTAAGNLSRLTSQAEQIVTVNRPSIDEMIDNLTNVSATLKATGAEIRRNPWRLMHRPSKREMDSANIHDAARAFADGASKLNQALTRLKAVPDNVESNDPALVEIRQSIEQAFGRFSQVEQALWEELVR